MTCVDLLSDTTYRQQAVEQLDQLLGNSNEFPVKATQIYGLRQIARQQPGRVGGFARHQRERAQRKYENASERARPALKAEIEFWTLVANLCSRPPSNWSVLKEGDSHLPEKLREKNIPAHRQGMTHEEQKRRTELKNCQQKWLTQWKNKHIPVFFERFCTYALYRHGMAENSQEE